MTRPHAKCKIRTCKPFLTDALAMRSNTIMGTWQKCGFYLSAPQSLHHSFFRIPCEFKGIPLFVQIVRFINHLDRPAVRSNYFQRTIRYRTNIAITCIFLSPQIKFFANNSCESRLSALGGTSLSDNLAF